MAERRWRPRFPSARSSSVWNTRRRTRCRDPRPDCRGLRLLRPGLRYRGRASAGCSSKTPWSLLFDGKLDGANEHELALFVAHDRVAVQAIAVGVELISAGDALQA